MKKNFKRRDFIKKAGVAAAAATAVSSFPAPAIAADRIEVNCVATWGRGYPGLGTGGEAVSQRISDLSDGRIVVNHYAGGERVGPLDVFTEVSSGNAQMYNSADYYWVGQHPGWGFFASVPFGMIATEINGWIRHGGGQELWDELGDEFGLKNFMAGNSGVQMGGWFNKEINSVKDFEGLKMRMGGVGSKILNEFGASAQYLPASEIYLALERGRIDATEFSLPIIDKDFGFNQIAKYYYYPGWHQPGSADVLMINMDVWNGMSSHEQAMYEAACQTSLQWTLSYAPAAQTPQIEVFEAGGTIVKEFPLDVLAELRVMTERVLGEEAKKDALYGEAYNSMKAFVASSGRWTSLQTLPL